MCTPALRSFQRSKWRHPSVHSLSIFWHLPCALFKACQWTRLAGSCSQGARLIVRDREGNQEVSNLSQGSSLGTSDVTVMGAVRESLSKEVTFGPSWRHRGLMMCQGKLGLLECRVSDDQTPGLAGPCLLTQLSREENRAAKCPLPACLGFPLLTLPLGPAPTPLCLSGHLRLWCLLRHHPRGLGQLLRIGFPQLLL